MNKFLELIEAKGHMKKHMILLMVLCIFYASIYEVSTTLLYQSDHIAISYLASYMLSLLVGGILAYLVHRISSILHHSDPYPIKTWILRFVGMQTILYLWMSILGYASFYLAMQPKITMVSYLVNAMLLLSAMLYIPFTILSFYLLKDIANPFFLCKKTFQILLHQYQKVFYATIILAMIIIGYRYLMTSLFSFQMGVALYDLPSELMMRWLPFLDVASWIPMLFGNSALWLPCLFSFVCAIIESFVLCLYLFYLGCVYREECQ